MMKRNMRIGGAALTAMVAFAAFAGGAVADGNGSPVLKDAPAQAGLSVHKHKDVEKSTRATGLPLSEAERAALGDPMANIDFDVYHVKGVDVKTNAGLREADKFAGKTWTAADIAAGKVTVDGQEYELEKVGTITTNASGDATGTYDLGVYIVAENLTNYPDPQNVTPQEPFTVFLPMTDPVNRNEWLYDVHVYPKNTVDGIEKTVTDGNPGEADKDAYKIGEKLTYKLASTIFAGDSNADGKVTGADLGYYYIEDQLTEGLEYASSTVAVDGTALTEGADYTFTNTNGKLGYSFTDAGLDKLAAASGKKVEVSITATVTANNTEGVLKNQAWFIPSNKWLINHGEKPGKPGEPVDKPGKPPVSNEVESKFGDIVVKKTNAAGTVSLAGATFSVHRAKNGLVCDKNDLGPAVASSEPTDANGMTAVKGLQLSDFYNGQKQQDLHGYCLVETKAPEGYELDPEPTPFTLTKEGSVTDLSVAYNDQARDANPDDNEGGNRHITNTKHNDLPLTGDGGGILLGLAAGFGLAAGGATVLSRRKRRTDEAAA